MTVYSATLHQKTYIPEHVSVSSPRLLKVNICVAAVLCMVLGAHIFVVNRIVAKRFEVTRLQQKAHELGAELAVREQTVTRGQDVENLIALVRRNGMVANSDGQTLFITSDVAFLP